jgi:hypothetical protein
MQIAAFYIFKVHHKIDSSLSSVFIGKLPRTEGDAVMPQPRCRSPPSPIDFLQTKN